MEVISKKVSLNAVKLTILSYYRWCKMAGMKEGMKLSDISGVVDVSYRLIC